MPEKTGKRRVFRVLVLAAVILVSLPLMFFLFLQTPWAKRLVAKRVASILSDRTGFTVVIEDIHGFVPTSLGFGVYSMADAEGEWLVVEDVSSHLSLAALLNRRVQFHELNAGTVRLERTPARQEPEEKEWSLPARPTLPTWLEIQDLQVEQLALGSGLVGVETSFALRGQYAPVPAKEGWDVALTAINQKDETTRAELRLENTPETLLLSLEAADVIFVPPMLGLKPGERVTLHLAGEGPVSDWNGALSVSAAGADVADIAMRIGATEGINADVSGTLALDQPVLPDAIRTRFGESAVIALALDISEEGALDVEEAFIDFDKGRVEFAGSGNLSVPDVELALTINHEDANDLLMPEADKPPVPLAAEAQLNLDRTRAAIRLDARLNDESAVDGDFEYRMKAPRVLKASLQVNPVTSVFPPAVKDLMPEGMRAVVIGGEEKGTYMIQQANMTMACAYITVDGAYNTHDDSGRITGTIASPRLECFSQLAQRRISGDAALQFMFRAADGAATLELDVEAEDVRVQEMRMPGGTFAFDAATETWPAEPLAGFTGEGKGSFRYVVPEVEQPDSLALSVKLASSSPDRLALDHVRIESRGAVVAGEGWINPRNANGQLAVDATVDNLEQLALLFGSEIGGALGVQARVTAEGAGPTVQATVDASLAQPLGLPDTVLALLGNETNVTASLRLDDKRAAVDAFQARSDVASVEGRGAYALDSREIEGHVELATERIVPRGDLPEAELRGQLQAGVDISGTADAMTVRGSANAEDFVYSNFRASTAQAEFEVAGFPDAPSGQINASATAEGLESLLNVDFALSEDTLHVPQFMFVTGDNRAEGNVQLNLETLLGQGRLQADFSNLAHFTQFVPADLAGSAQADVTLETREDEPHISVDASSERLTVGGFTMSSAELTGEVQAPFTAPSGRAQLSASEAELGAIEFTMLAVEASGDGEAMNVETRSEGLLQDATPFTNEAQASVAVGEESATIVTLIGTLEDYAYRLQDPATISYGEGRLVVTPARLSIGEGSITAEAESGSESVRAQVGWQNLPLTVAALFGAPAIGGAAEGNILVSGDPGAPTVTAQLTLAQVDIGEETAQEFPPLQASAEAQLDGGMLSAQAEASAGDTVSASANVRFPVGFSVSPFAFSLPESGALEGALDANVDLRTLPALFDLEDHDIRGLMNARFNAAGSLGGPEISGQATVEDGRYENKVSGTILSGINLALNADGEAIVIERFVAQDGGEGEVSAEGRLRLEPDQRYPFELNAAMQRARLIRRDNMTGVVDGTATLTGTMREMAFAGEIALSPAVIRLEGSGPAKVPELDIIEIDDPTGVTEAELAVAAPDESTEEEEISTPGFVMALDVACEIPGDVQVVREGVDSTWRGNLQIGGTVEQPRITGELTVYRGQLSFLGRRFDLEEGTIVFDGSYPPSPYMNMGATAQTADITARLLLTGTLNNLDVQLTSEPALPEDEILARVLFGKNLDNISPVQAVELGRIAASMAGAEGDLRFLTDKPQALGLDRLDIGQAVTEEGAASLGFGKYLTEDVSVEVEQEIGGDTSTVQIGADLSDNLRLEGEVGTDEGGRIGIFWQKDY